MRSNLLVAKEILKMAAPVLHTTWLIHRVMFLRIIPFVVHGSLLLLNIAILCLFEIIYCLFVSLTHLYFKHINYLSGFVHPLSNDGVTLTQTFFLCLQYVNTLLVKRRLLGELCYIIPVLLNLFINLSSMIAVVLVQLGAEFIQLFFE